LHSLRLLDRLALINLVKKTNRAVVIVKRCWWT
jgi:hypothetical protein